MQHGALFFQRQLLEQRFRRRWRLQDLGAICGERLGLSVDLCYVAGQGFLHEGVRRGGREANGGGQFRGFAETGNAGRFVKAKFYSRA